MRDKDLKAMLFGAPGEEVLLRVNPGTINHFQNSCYSFLNIPSELAQFISTPRERDIFFIEEFVISTVTVRDLGIFSQERK